MSKDFSKYGDNINHPTSLIMSGVESDMYFDIAVSAGFDRLLVSYHYIQKKGKKWLKERMEQHPNVKLMIDSGAHTFHANEEEYKQKPMEYWEKYLDKYTKFVKENKDYIFSCVELDIGNIVGFDVVDQWRQKYFMPLKEHGVMVCYVWHTFDGKNHWEEMCRDYDYVGFSLMNSNITEAEIMKMINIARRYGAFTHGFAITRVDLMSRVPFFTGDSTTWLVGTQYGELNWFDGRKMKRLKKKDWKTVYKQKYIKLGANAKLMQEENPYELIRINALVFKQAEEYIRKRVRGKMYWLSDRNKLVAKGGEQPVTKKIIRRKKKIEETIKEETVETIVDNTNNITKPTRSQSGGGVSEEIDRPKTKYEEFQAQSQPQEKVILNLDEQISKLPPIEWFDTDGYDFKEVAQRISMSIVGLQQEEVLDVIYNYCIFLRDTEEVDEIPDNELLDMAKLLLKTSVESREDAVDQLVLYYSQNLVGERTDFVVDESTLPMIAPERPREREAYLEDDKFDLIDVSEEEMQGYLPAPKESGEMPEIDELDKELSSQGIVAVRDDKGRFLKGQKRVRKPKQLWSKHFPKLACNTCYKAGDCPEYIPDMACAYEKVFKKFNTRNMEDIIDGMTSMADVNMERMQRLMLFETMDGGMADPTLTTMIDQNMRMLMQIKSLHDSRATVIATQTRVLKDDGTDTTTTTVSNPGGGILAQLFGGGNDSSNRKEVNEDDIIDAE